MVIMVMFTILAVLVAVPVGSIVFTWFYHPAAIFQFITRARAYKCGLKTKYTSKGKNKYCYSERGSANGHSDTLLFLHGYSANKEMFLSIVEKLPRSVHIILLDLPGHGGSSVPLDYEDIEMNKLMGNVHEFVTLLGLHKKGLHMLGTSMGGAMSLLYAGTYPSHVSKLTVMCPAMKTPIMTEFLLETYKGENRLLPDTEEGMQYMLDLCSHQKFKLPKQALKGLLHLRRFNEDFLRTLFKSFTDKEVEVTEVLENSRQNITMPTQVIWGQDDQLIHVSGVEVLKEKLPNVVQVDVLDKCGHTCVLDRPGKVTKCLLQFRDELPKKFR